MNILKIKMPRIQIKPYYNNKKKVSQVSQRAVILKRDNPIRRKRSRAWAFTLNNYTAEDRVSMSQRFLTELKSTYFIFQEEITKKGVPHFQGHIEFKSQVSFSTLKAFDRRIHWEPCRKITASKNYCGDIKKRVGKLYQSHPPKIEMAPVPKFNMEIWKAQMIEESIRDVCAELTRKGYCLCVENRCACRERAKFRTPGASEEGPSAPC